MHENYDQNLVDHIDPEDDEALFLNHVVRDDEHLLPVDALLRHVFSQYEEE